MADPMYDELSKLRIISTSVPLQLLIDRALTTAVAIQSLPLYNTILRQNIEQLAEKLIQRLKPKPVLEIDKEQGLLILYKAQIKRHPVIIAVPLSLEKLRKNTTGTIMVKLGSKLYELPIVAINGQKTILVPLIQLAQHIRTAQKQSLKQEQAQTPELVQGEKIPSPPSIVSTAVPPIVPTPSRTPIIGSEEEREGMQKEILVI